MNRFIWIILLLASPLVMGQSSNEAQPIKKELPPTFTVEIMDNPVHVRKLFQRDFSFSEAYLRFVTQQSPTWYLHYFHRNAMQRYGWENHWELYQERFFVWSDWLQNPFRFRTLFDWNKVRNLFQFLTPNNAPQQVYRRSYLAENSYIQSQINQLKSDDVLAEEYTPQNIGGDDVSSAIIVPLSNLGDLVRELKRKGVAVETHQQKPFFPKMQQNAHHSRTRDMAQERVRGPQSYQYREPRGKSESMTSYATPAPIKGPVRTVVPDVNTTSMGNAGGTASSAAVREQ